jgi:tetratricopeptide (TPR) repeat protein
VTVRVDARRRVFLAVLAVCTVASSARAVDPGEARGQAQRAIDDAERRTDEVSEAAKHARPRTVSAPERVAAGDIMLRTHNYERAIQLFSQVLELRRQSRATEDEAADAEMLLAESYFQDGQLHSARRHARGVLEMASRPAYGTYSGRALSRLVDVAIRTEDPKVLAEAVQYAERLNAPDGSGSLAYARAKVWFAAHDYARARESVGAVPSGSAYAHQAQYLLGVILTKEAAAAAPVAVRAVPATGDTQSNRGPSAQEEGTSRYAAAIEQFRRVTRLPPDSTEHQHVIALAWMAIGRLYYEAESYLEAADAYARVERSSPEFPTMLQELAWVYAQLGDHSRAQRALEVLSITHPDTLGLADGSLLRADLMLRSGQFDKALTLYRSVRRRFDPIREQVQHFLKTSTDPAVYYDELVAERLEPDRARAPLPSLVIEWARQEAEDDHVFGVVDDVARSRDLIDQARTLVRELDALLSSPARAKAFEEVKRPLETTLGLLNQIGKAELALARAMDDLLSSEGGAELRAVRRERRALMKRMDWLPTTPGDFLTREAAGEQQWNGVSQQLQQATIEVDRLNAITNALRQLLMDPGKQGVSLEPTARQRMQAEVDANQADVQTYRDRVAQLRHVIELGRAQVGLGDQRYVDDAETRTRFLQVFGREVALTASNPGDPAAGAYAETIRPLLVKADSVTRKLNAVRERLERLAAEMATKLRDKIWHESAALDGFASELDALDEEARLLVGQAAVEHFARVGARLRDIVLRADVGIVQQAWEVREEQRGRVRSLQRERAREEQNLNDELREVLDDAEVAP